MTDTTDSTVRLLRLLTLLQQHAVWTGPELADRLVVSVRGVRRDISRLRELGYPVHSERGLGGGYRLAPGKAMPPLVLDDEEAVAVAVSLSLAAGGTVAGIEDEAMRALAKLDQVVPQRLRERIDAVRAATVTVGAGTTPVDSATLTAVARACRDSLQLRFSYRRARSEEDEARAVEPYRLVATARRWYLMAWDRDRDDWRIFRLDRMSELHVTTWRFTPRDAPDAVDYVTRGVSRSAYAFDATIRVHAPAALVRDLFGPTLAQVEEEAAAPCGVGEPGEPGVTCLLRTGSDSLADLASHLCFLPWEFEVLEPAELRGEVAALAARLRRAAGST